MLRPKALHHVALSVADMDKTLHFYQALGLTLLRTSGPAADGVRSAVLRIGSQELNVFHTPGGSPAMTPRGPACTTTAWTWTPDRWMSSSPILGKLGCASFEGPCSDGTAPRCSSTIRTAFAWSCASGSREANHQGGQAHGHVRSPDRKRTARRSERRGRQEPPGLAARGADRSG